VVTSKKSLSHRTKAKHVAAEKKPAHKPHATASAASSDTITIDRRKKHERRSSEHHEHGDSVVAEHPALERRIKVNRRRQIDPTTCERDYTPEEVEFMAAIDDYKRRSGRMFPTCSEVLEVIRALGYKKCAEDETPVGWTEPHHSNAASFVAAVNLPMTSPSPTIAN
jgi:hypothetical protein